jgi:predicted ATP-grasp superfamily ATP-dependent carboligase
MGNKTQATKEAPMKPSTFAVEITISGRPEISRFFSTLTAARKWAAFCAKLGATRILAGGPGGMEVA